MKWIALIVVGVLFIILFIVRMCYIAKYRKDIESFSYRFRVKFSHRFRRCSKVVQDNRPVVYYTTEPASLYYRNPGYRLNEETMVTTRYFNRERDNYGKGPRIFWSIFLGLSITLFLIISFAFLVNVLVSVFGMNLNSIPGLVAFSKALGNIPYLSTSFLFLVFAIISMIINSVKRHLYFLYKPYYLDYLNTIEIRNEGLNRYIKVD